VAGLFVLAAYMLWQGRTIIAIGAILVIVVAGLDTVLELVPWSAVTRARIEKSVALDDRYPSHRYRILLRLGIGGLVGNLVRWIMRDVFALEDFVMPLVGLIAIIWKTRHAGNTDSLH
jgi:hypothetical protein